MKKIVIILLLSFFFLSMNTRKERLSKLTARADSLFHIDCKQEIIQLEKKVNFDIKCLQDYLDANNIDYELKKISVELIKEKGIANSLNSNR